MMKVEMQSPGAAHWSRQQYESLFSEGDGGPERFTWVVEKEFTERSERAPGERSEPLAFLVAQGINGEWELENMAVAPSVRRQGVGAQLLKKLIAQARAANGKSVFLEVRETNVGARALYQKIGFEEVGLRKGYYSDPREAAVLYRLTFY